MPKRTTISRFRWLHHYSMLGILLCLLLSNYTTVEAQSSFQYEDNIRLVRVEYRKNITISKDPNVGVVYLEPEYSNFGYQAPYPGLAQINHPIAYVSGNVAELQATFELSCQPDRKIFVRGDGPEGFDISPTLLLGDDTDTKRSIDWTTLLQAFQKQKVGFWENFEITWYVSDDAYDPTRWVKVGTSSHPMYVTYQTSLATIPIYHTLIYYGCKNAKDDSNEEKIVDNIYNRTFGPKNLRRRDNPHPTRFMSYWGHINPLFQSTSCYSTTALISYQDASCGSWEEFFRDMVSVQGIGILKPVSVFYEITAAEEMDLQKEMQKNIKDVFGKGGALSISIEYSGIRHNPVYGLFYYPFFVKNWNFDATSSFYIWDQEYVYAPNGTMPIQGPYDPVINDAGVSTIIPFGPKTGAASQGNIDPRSTFQDHAITTNIGHTKYYDPSYGSPIMTDGLQWEKNSLDGVGFTYLKWKHIVNGQTKITKLIWVSKNFKAIPQTVQSTTFKY